MAASGRTSCMVRRRTAQHRDPVVTSRDGNTGSAAVGRERSVGLGQRPPLYCRPCEPSSTRHVNRRPLGCLVEIVETLVLTLIIFFVIQNWVAQPYRVQQQSMEHTLEPDQYVLVAKLTPHFDQYHRGDIVVFTPPANWAQPGDGTPYIKRVIGIGGDTVGVRDDGSVYVNGTKLSEPYLFADAPDAAPPTVPSAGPARRLIGARCLFGI